MNGLIQKCAVAIIIVAAGIAGWWAYQSTQYDFQTLDGETYSWNKLHGEWTVINYFAPWCAPCLREMPELNALSRALPENTRLFAVNYDRQSREQLEEMVSKFSINVPVIVAEDETRLPMQKPPYLPATFIIGPEGDVVDTIMGEVTAEGIKHRLAQLKNGAS